MITIAENASKDKGLTSVSFPDSVAEIGANAFILKLNSEGELF